MILLQYIRHQELPVISWFSSLDKRMFDQVTPINSHLIKTNHEERQWLASAGSRTHAAKSSSSMARYEQLANYDMGLVPETVGKTENPNIPWFITMLSAEMVFSGEVFPLSIVERIDLKIWQLVFGNFLFNLYISKGNFDMCWPDLDQQSCHPLGWRDTESTRVKPGKSCSICWTWEKAVCTGRDSYHWWLMLDKWSCSSDDCNCFI